MERGPEEPVDPDAALVAERRVLAAEKKAEAALDPAIGVWLKSAKAVLLAEGFRREIKQARKPGQVWGVIRQEPDDMQIHVRAFKDGRLESEVELSNKYVQHLWSHRRSAHPEVMEILGRHGMPTERVSETFIPITGSKEGKLMPEGRTRNHHVALAFAVGLGLLIGRHYLQRIVLKAIPGRRVKSAMRLWK
jgi:hypothetical protein